MPKYVLTGIILNISLILTNVPALFAEPKSILPSFKLKGSQNSGKIAGPPLYGAPKAVGDLVNEMATKGPGWVLNANLPTKLLEEALENNAVFEIDNRSHSALEVRNDSALFNSIFQRMVYILNQGDTGGVDYTNFRDEMLELPTSGDDSSLSHTGPTGIEQAGSNILCTKLTLLIPCGYTQFISVFGDCRSVIIHHRLGGCDRLRISWDALKNPDNPCSICGEPISAPDPTPTPK